MRKDFKRIEHRKRCRICWDVAQLKRGRRTYCPRCFYLAFQAELVEQEPTNLTPDDLIEALQHGVITGRSAASLLDRILKERTA